MYDEYGNLYIPKNYGKIAFSKMELKHIVISVAVLTIAFTLALRPANPTMMDMLIILGASAVVVLTGFLLHELAHKFVAQRYGAWAEFRMYPFGLMMALFLSFLGFLFAAPGAVYIQGRITKKQNGLISIAGPATNLVFGSVFLLLWLLTPGEGWLTFVLNMTAVLSLFLAVFNLLPIPPLDGSKVLSWNPAVWVMTIGISGFLLMIGWGIIVLA